MLAERIRKHGAGVWLINTGWTGGPYGTGERIPLAHTRAIVKAVLDGTLSNAETETDPIFGLAVPKEVPGVPQAILNPRATWTDGNAYDEKAAELADMFVDNFKEFKDGVSEEVKAAGPRHVEV